MFLVVAFSSSLDVAAIEMELGTPLDYNRKFNASVTVNYESVFSSFPPFFPVHSPGELNTVGISNLVSGLFGGYTGSYIFSQTIFSMRRGVSSTVNGYIIAVGEILVVLLPVSLTSYIPKMFFGSLLVLIAADLMFEWLIAARDKMMLSEYLVCLFTFIAIQSTNIEFGEPWSFPRRFVFIFLCFLSSFFHLGMLIGILSATLSFVITYSKLQSVSEVTLKSSTVIRTFEERSLLLSNRGKIITISFGGYIFFGSSVQVLEQIKSKLVLSSPSLLSLRSGMDETSEKEQLLYQQRPEEKKHLPVSGAFDVSRPTVTPQKPHLVHHQYSMILKTPSSNRKKQCSNSTGTTPYPEKGGNLIRKDGTSDDEETSLLGDKVNQKEYGSTQQSSTPSSGMKLVLKSPAVSRNPDPLQSHSAASSYQSSVSSHHSHRPIPSAYDLSPTSLRNAIQLSQIDNPHSHYSDSIYGNGVSCIVEIKGETSSEEKDELKVNQAGTEYVKNKDQKDDKTWLVGETDDVFDISHHEKYTDNGRPVSTRTSSQESALDEDSPFKELRKSKNDAWNDIQNVGNVSTLKPSTSLLDLVFKGQQQRREQQQQLQRKSSHEHSPPDLLSSSSHGDNNSTSPRKATAPRINGLPPLPAVPVASGPSREPSAALNSASSYFPLSILHPSNAVSNEDTAPVLYEDEITTEYLVLDFTDVKGVDATAARSCFLTLVHLMKNANVTVVFASLSQQLQDLLKAHHVVDYHSIIIPDIDDALEWCEDQVLARLSILLHFSFDFFFVYCILDVFFFLQSL
jgi:hypothetical protein